MGNSLEVKSNSCSRHKEDIDGDRDGSQKRMNGVKAKETKAKSHCHNHTEVYTTLRAHRPPAYMHESSREVSNGNMRRREGKPTKGNGEVVNLKSR